MHKTLCGFQLHFHLPYYPEMNVDTPLNMFSCRYLCQLHYQLDPSGRMANKKKCELTHCVLIARRITLIHLLEGESKFLQNAHSRTIFSGVWTPPLHPERCATSFRSHTPLCPQPIITSQLRRLISLGSECAEYLYVQHWIGSHTSYIHSCATIVQIHRW